MSLLSPIWLLLGLVSIPIVLMYMLKLRRREIQISSILLWQMLLLDRQANTPWQRLKRNWLLFLQLLILLVLTISLARPVLKIPQVATGSLVVLLDASASMSATDILPNRFEAARNVVEGLIDNLKSSNQMTLIQVTSQPIVIAASESDKNTLLEKLQEVNVTQDIANWDTSFALAAGAVSSFNDESASIVIISDGGIVGNDLTSLPAEVRFVPIGNSDENLAISTLAVRPTELSSELFTSITNYGVIEKKAVLSIYLNNFLVKAQEIDIPGLESKGVVIPNFPIDSGIISARLSKQVSELATGNNSLDFLEDDNVAFAVNSQFANRSVLLVSPGNFFLEQIFTAYPATQAYRAIPTENPATNSIQFILPEAAFDLYVLDSSLPGSGGLDIPELPKGNLLLINPPSNPLFSVTGVFSPTQEMQIQEHPLTMNLVWDTVSIKQANHVNLPIWAEVLINSPDGPIVFVGEDQGRRIAVLNFDLHDSDLPLQIAFPILFSNLLDYLLPSQVIQHEGSLQPNQIVELLVPSDVDHIEIADPNNSIYDLRLSGNGYFFSNTKELGVYAVNFVTTGIQRVEYFAVNLFSPSESDITPVQNIQIGRTSIPASSQSGFGQLENWNWFATAGLLFLFLEWWFYHRGWTQSFSSWVRRVFERSSH